jgi:hypothetical protein
VSQPASERKHPADDEIGPGTAPEPASQRAKTPSDRVIAIGRATLRGVDFRKARFDKFTLEGCLFVSCDFRALRLDQRYQPLFAARPASIFRDCRFDGADLRRLRPGESRFEHCTFDDALLDGWRSEVAEFVGCRFAGALGRVIFNGRPSGNAGRGVLRKRNEFAQNDFREADLDQVIFTAGIDLSAQWLPAAERYVRLDRFPQRLARAHAEIVRWDVHEERVAAVTMLRELATRYREQREVIASRMAATGAAARVQTRVWALLERAIA